MHVVYEHKNGAKLWMSGSKAAFDAHEHGVKTALLLGLYQPEKLPGGVVAARRPGLVDRENLSPDEIESTRVLATRASAEVALELLAGMSVLVQCDSGLNRSGLVCALAMIRLGVAPADAVAAIRARRSPSALSNRVFLEIVAAGCRPT